MKKISIAALLYSLASPALYALGDFQINGFLSAGVAWSDVNYLSSGIEPTYLSEIRKQPSFDKDTNVGIQITKNLRSDISITTQLYAQGSNNFDVEATWAFLKWEPNNHWQFRVGRVRTEPYMLSDYVDVSYAYPWIRPPQEVYSQIPFSNFTGIDGKYTRLLWGYDLSFSAFAGASTGHLEFPVPPTNTILDEVQFWLRHLYSFNLRYGNEVFSVRAGLETARISLYPNSGTFVESLNTFMNNLVALGLMGTDEINYFAVNNLPASFMGVGYQFDWKNMVSMGELVKRHTASPLIASAVGWYVMGGYRVNQLLPHVTFARERVLDNKTRRFSGMVNTLALNQFGLSLDALAQSVVGTSPYYEGGVGDQTSVTVGLRWDLIEGVAVKAEFQHVHPDRNSSGLFDVNPLKSVNIYSFAIDAVM